MSHEDAVAALTAAAAVDPMTGGSPEQAVAAPDVVSPAGEAAATEQPTPVAPEVAPAAPEAPAADSEQFFNPDDLDPALLPGWKQLQGAFTQRMQGLAAERQQLEALGDPETLAEAVELYQRISDDRNWPQLHAELSAAMQEAGLSPAQADALAKEEIQEQAAAGDPLAGLDLSDPELAPLAAALKAQQAQTQTLAQQIQALTAQNDLQSQMAQEEQATVERTNAIRSQLGAIQQARPDYTEEDLRAVIERAPFFNDDLIQAQASYEADIARRLDRYYQGKQAAALSSIQPQAGAGASSHVDNTPQSIEQAADEAVELLRGMQAAGEFDQ